jgi:hypothetical protein
MKRKKKAAQPSKPQVIHVSNLIYLRFEEKPPRIEMVYKPGLRVVGVYFPDLSMSAENLAMLDYMKQVAMEVTGMKKAI